MKCSTNSLKFKELEILAQMFSLSSFFLVNKATKPKTTTAESNLSFASTFYFELKKHQKKRKS